MGNYNSVKMSFLKKVSFLLNVILLFSIVFDPYNTIFHVKNLSFILFVLVSLPFIDVRYFYVPLIFLTVFFISLSFGLITNQNLDWNSTIAMLKSFLFLLYFFWMPCKYLNTFKVFYYACLGLAILQIGLLVLLLFFPDFLILFTIAGKAGEDSALGGIIMRNYYGIFLPMVFYKTVPLLVIPLGFQSSRFFENKSFKNFVLLMIFAVGFFVSGTRADMLSCVILVLASFIFYGFYVKKRIFSTVILIALLSVLFFIVAIFFLTTHEYSTDIKTGHFQSFMELFDESILKFLLVGNGPVSYMYTSGFGKNVTLTELTYLEMIKNFGFVQSILLIFILFLPVFNIKRNPSVSCFQKFTLSLAYTAYLFISGTNPLLISSTGFTAFAVAFSLGNKDVFENFKIKEEKHLYKKRLKNYFLKFQLRQG